ncbi:MAG: hypothetical protein MUF28_10940 [Ignavibacterium sp.]|nr:hypothetical protein [Ignavibacterium sp.]
MNNGSTEGRLNEYIINATVGILISIKAFTYLINIKALTPYLVHCFAPRLTNRDLTNITESIIIVS